VPANAIGPIDAKLLHAAELLNDVVETLGGADFRAHTKDDDELAELHELQVRIHQVRRRLAERERPDT
jgi:Mg2+ and Co2+ transporter CorA